MRPNAACAVTKARSLAPITATTSSPPPSTCTRSRGTCCARAARPTPAPTAISSSPTAWTFMRPTCWKTQDERNARTGRAAAEGLGRLRDKDAVALILETIRYCGKDLILEQALARALIDIAGRVAVLSALKKVGQASRLPSQVGGGGN